jgi:TrmH family RNA methyltransferase
MSDDMKHGTEYFYDLKDADLRKRGICIGEGKLVVERMIDATSFEVVSVLCTPNLREHFTGRSLGRFPVIALGEDRISGIAGFDFHRGVMAAARRPVSVSLSDFLASHPDASRFVIVSRITEVENIGSIIRSARAFGFDALILGPGSCDPFNRKAVRASMAGCFTLPILETDTADAVKTLRLHKTTLLAATTSGRAIPVTSLFSYPGKLPSLNTGETVVAYPFDPARKCAIMFGNEASGLSEEEIRLCDLEVTISMDRRADSLNVGVACGIFLHYLGKY